MIIPERPAVPVGWILSLLLAGAAMAQTPPPASPGPPDSPSEAILAPVIVTAPPPVSSSSELLIPRRDFELRPQGRPADVLRYVPGLILGQHQGGGKSEQYILRGFDADHGTDVALFLDGMPINLRSHAHGQGYADQHFVIPETLKQVDAFKGPYFVELGDFATAGAFNFVTLDTVPENVLEAAGGSWNTQRYLALLSPTRERVKTLFAGEIYGSDGPFDRPQRYIRTNFFAKASAWLSESVEASAWASYLNSNWFASGQIPTRALRSGLIDRLGSIDDSEGGNTQRFQRQRRSPLERLGQGDGAGPRLRAVLPARSLLRLHVLPHRSGQRRRDRAVGPASDRPGPRHLLRAPRHPARHPAQVIRRLPVPLRPHAGGARQRARPAPARADRGL